MIIKTIPLCLLLLLGISCVKKNSLIDNKIEPVSDDRIAEQSVSLKEAKLSSAGELSVIDTKDQEIAFFRGITDYQINSTNLVVQLEDDYAQSQTTYHQIGTDPVENEDERTDTSSELDQIVYYDNECSEILNLSNISKFELTDFGLAALNHDQELALYNSKAEEVFNLENVTSLELDIKGIFIQALQGSYYLTSKGVVFLSQLGILSYQNLADGEMKFQVLDVRDFRIDHIEGKSYIEYNLKGRNRSIRHKELD